ncbi:hypothetical protein [Streptomyces afghaniensis]|uniref:hypothetical protein n=1 Tax=Streptomyces afghaniensis TaxID=66865 RepID=UPI00278A6B95|nr:hypothetical protein [Streptomyces afghaniensis]MDQ1018080.1 hypothetical protein [Streptomyces afghaniensis]
MLLGPALRGAEVREEVQGADLIQQHLDDVERRMAESRETRSALRDLAARAATTAPRTCTDADLCSIIAEPRR